MSSKENVNGLARIIEMNMRRVILMLDTENEHDCLRPTILHGRWRSRNRNNTELRDLMKQLRRDMIKLEKAMAEERRFGI
ncbi:hypothetical protein [Lysinibacillus sp. NPDC093216]|uniref:hypothetical protein n=1 Tax=Lysinibacillus sp. NPDC093216 TaxID=3390576 RepID=UPI003CFE5E65